MTRVGNSERIEEIEEDLRVASVEIDRLRAILIAAGIPPDEAGLCEHGVDEWEYCEPCNREYKRARKANGYDDDASI